MGSIINEKTYSINNQMASGSRSSLLISHVDFKRNEDEDDLMSAKCLQNKYNVLSADNKMSFNNMNNELNVKMNGQLRLIANNSNNLTNGNISDNNITDGIPDPKLVLYPRERIQLEWREPRKIGAGLANLGNTCFMNSVLQCLTYCPPLVNYLLYNDDEHSTKCNIGFCMTCEMTKHIKLVHSHSGDTIKPIYICRRLKSIAKHFTFGRQEDAHEFLRYVIDNMWRSCLSIYELNNNQKLDPLSKETTAINRIFGGYHRSQVICFQCKEKSNTYDYFMDFMLDIKNVMSLEKALDKFVAAEILQHDNAYKCPRCKRKVLAKKQFTVHSEPNVATFQLKRFDYNRIFGGKITKSITYPEKLNLRPYMSENKGPPILYKLNSVLVHLGPTCNSGHYFCYVRNSNNCWYLMDDSRIVQVNLNQVLNQQAYVLFYVRIDTDFNKPNPVKNFVSHTTPHGIQLSSVSSPEMTFRNHKYNYNVCHNGNYVSAHNSTKLNTTASPLKSLPFEAIKHPQPMNKEKPNRESCGSNMKGLVPYASDSSDEELSKQSTNGGVDCDRDTNRRLSAINHKSDINDAEHNSLKLDKIDNTFNKCNSSSTQSIPNSRISINNHQNHNSMESMSCAPLAPITLKVKATTSSWHVVETLRSPSVASGSSTNSVNSTTEWTISECSSECNTNQHTKHHKHRNKHNRCASIANGNVKQVMSTKNKIPHNRHDFDERINESKPNTQHSNDHFETNHQTNESSSELRLFVSSKNELKTDVSHINATLETSNCKYRENHISDSVNQRDQSDRRSISSHRSSNDSSRDKNSRRNETEKNSFNNGVISSDDNSSTSSHSRKKRKHRKHKLIITHMKRTSNYDSESNEDKNGFKLKHKKKKKKKKHRKRSTSDSESNSSSDGLQWIERTKETVEKERNSNVSADSVVKNWNENVCDLANKRIKLEEDLTNKCHNNNINHNNNGNSDALTGLLKTPFRGFGDKVIGWDGRPNHLNTFIEEENKHLNNTNDDYDEEFDRGKTKKVKTHQIENNFYDTNHNPFQKFQTSKYRNNGTFNSHNKPHYDKHFKSKHNNHKSWKTHHNRYDNDRRH